MPRERRPRATTTVIPTNSLLASGARYEGTIQQAVYLPPKDWQRECYRHYDICGEARFAARFFGNCLSRATLGVSRRDRRGVLQPVTSGPSVDRLDELCNGREGQSQMLAAMGVHLTIAGECWLVGRSVTGAWEVVSVLEMNVAGTRWSIDYGDGKPPVILDNAKDVVIRVWLPHPARRIEADSPFRSLLPVLSEIEWLTRHIFAQTSSRLAGAGLLLIPSEATFPPPPVEPGAEQAPATTTEVTGIMKMLADAMNASMAHPDAVMSKVPIVTKMPGEYTDKVRLLHFWSDLDEKALEMRSAATNRFFLGMDLPPEQMAGMSSNTGTGGGRSNGISHWGQWQVEEQTIKMHVEPALEMVVNCITIYYLRPLLEDQPDAGMDLATYDTSALRLRPDRSQESLELGDRGLVKESVQLRENGFDPDADALTDDEFKRWILRKIATGSATPDQVQAALALLGVQLPTDGTPPPEQVSREARPAPSLDAHPTRPRTPAEAATLLPLPVAEALVLRALERAGNRIRQTAGVAVPGVPAFAMHTVHPCNGAADEFLKDAWSTAPLVLTGTGVDVDRVVATLNAYCRSLMSTQRPHTRGELARFLEASCRA